MRHPIARRAVLAALLLTPLPSAAGGGGEPETGFCAPPPALTKKHEKKRDALAAKVFQDEAKLEVLADKRDAAEAALAEAEAALAEAEQLPEGTPAEKKAKKKALAQAKAALHAAQHTLDKLGVKEAKREKKRSKRIDKALALDPTTFVGFAPEPEGASPFDPPWASAPALRELVFEADPGASAEENGLALRDAILSLQPGDRLEIGGGVYSIAPLFVIALQGSVTAPIRIEARAGEKVVWTRPDASQNVVNVGDWTPGSAAFLLLRGIEITGGSAGIRLLGASEVWIDRCHVHHTGEAAITANSVDTDHLYLTRNHIHHTSGYGEGMYLGANGGTVVMRDSIIARNHIHDTGDIQGDGIEVKQGSFGNWIVENCIHDTHYPCILLYGTAGNPVNVVERNVCIGSQDNVMQVQGEAIVRNNLLVDGVIGFYSHDHQGLTRDLRFVHNTIVTTGVAAFLKSWNGRPGMVFANNVVYSKSAASVVFQGGSAGVAFSGNVLLGDPWNVPATGWVAAGSIADFFHGSFDGTRWVFRPRASVPWLGAADASFAEPLDLAGEARSPSPAPGCLEPLLAPPGD